MTDCDFALMFMQSSDPPGIHNIIKDYLKPFDSTHHDLPSLYQEHFRFISESICYIYDQLESFLKPKPSELFESYKLLLNCLKKISHVMVHSHVITMYKYWWMLISRYIENDNYHSAKLEVQGFMRSLDQNVSGKIVPTFDERRDKHLSEIILSVLMCYVQCLAKNIELEEIILAKNIELEEIILVIREIQPWRVLDEDMSRFTWLLSCLTHTACLLVKKPHISNEEIQLTAKLSAVILLEHMQVSRVNVMQELLTLIQLENFWKHEFLWRMLDHVAKETKAVRQCSEDTKEWDVESTYRSCLLQLQALEKRSCHPTLWKTIHSTISIKLILRKQEKSMNYIVTGRKLREKGIKWLDKSIENLDKAISAIAMGDLQSKNNDEYGAGCHVRAQALCLRALCNNEGKLRNSKDCIQDIKEAINLWLDRDYCQFVAGHTYLSLTTVKLLCYLCDMILLEVKFDGTKEIFEMMIKLLNQSSNVVKECVAMLWQSRSCSHALCNSHESDRLLETVLKSCNISNDIKAICNSTDTDNLKHAAFELERKDPATIKSSYLAAYLYYNLGNRMILQGSFPKALCYANKSRMLRESLFQISFKMSRKEQDGSTMMRWHVDPLMATNAWSTDFEDFILTPNNILKCYLESILQEGTISEILGDGKVAQNLLLFGKDLSLDRGWCILGVRFLVAIGKIYRKKQCWDLSKQELLNARKLCSSIACEKCKVVLEGEINHEFGNYYRKMYCNEPNDQHYQIAINQFDSSERRLRNELLPIDARIGKIECGCEVTYVSDPWKLDCRICLLRVLTQKAKWFVAKRNMESAQQVLLESTGLVMCVRSFCSSHSELAFSYLVEHVKQNKIKHVPGLDIANLLYTMSWVSLMNSHDKGKSKQSLDKLTLISGLKLALIMSCKVPELFRKVAQLLAILYALLPDIDPPVGALLACQWSCFCHQLTLGSNLDSIFSYHLKELYHVSDPDDILNSLAPNLDVDLEKFVTKYFEALPPHTILGMTILNNKYMGLLEILLEESFMPSKYGAHLMMSRFKSKGKPVVVLLPVEPIAVFDGLEDCPSMFRGTGGHRICPWGTKTIVDKIAPGFQKLTDYIAFSFIPNDKYTEQDESSLLAWKKYLDQRVCNLVSRMEKWFGDWKHILLGEDKSGCHIVTSQEAICIFQKRQRGTNATSLSKEPVIMLLDIDINMLPWESMAVLRNQEIYRMPSISSIFYTYYRLIHSDIKKSIPVLNPRNAYYVVNPDGTHACADPTEIYVADQLRRIHHLKGKSFESVDANEILTILLNHDFYLYMGHGDGFQYIPRDKVVNLLRCAATTLMGCDSALLVLNGSYIPSGAPLDYILAGSPIAIGNLWSVFPYGAGVVLMALYENWIGDMSKDGETGIGSFLVKARDSPKLVFKYLDGAAPVCYGIPTLIHKEKPRSYSLQKRKSNIRGS